MFRLRPWTCNTQHFETKNFEISRRPHHVKFFSITSHFTCWLVCEYEWLSGKAHTCDCLKRTLLVESSEVKCVIRGTVKEVYEVLLLYVEPLQRIFNEQRIVNLYQDKVSLSTNSREFSISNHMPRIRNCLCLMLRPLMLLPSAIHSHWWHVPSMIFAEFYGKTLFQQLQSLSVWTC